MSCRKTQKLLEKRKYQNPAQTKIAVDDTKCTARAQNTTIIITRTLRTYTVDLALGHRLDKAGGVNLLRHLSGPIGHLLLVLSKNAKITSGVAEVSADLEEAATD